MPEITPKAFREWIAVIAAFLALASSAAHYLITASPSSPAITMMQDELSRRIKADADLQTLFNELHENQSLLKQRVESLERQKEVR